MRWLLVSAQHHPSQGGVGAYVNRFVHAAKSAGWHVELMTRPGEMSPPDIPIHAVRTADMDPSFMKRIEALRAIERVRPYRYGLWSLGVAESLMHVEGHFDAIEFVDVQAEGYVALTSRRVRDRWRGTPMIVHAHTPMFVEEEINGADVNRFGRGIYHEWERRAIGASDGVIVTSSLLGRRLATARRPAVIPYPIEARADASKRIVNVEILFVGSVQPRKGVDVWARSLNRVFRERADASAVMIGPDTPTGPNGCSMVDHVISLIEPSFRERFRWAGAVAHDEVLRAIERAALVVAPSRFESFSFVAAEAIERGRPVVITDQVGLGEHVTGIPTCRTGDHEQLAARQIEALADLRSAAANIERCRTAMLEACSAKRHLAMRERFIRELQAASRDDENEFAEPDSLELMARFLSDVELAERESALSSVGS